MYKSRFLCLVTIISLLGSQVTFAKDFSDIGSDHPAKVAIDYLVDDGCVSGYEDGSFQPAKAISRVETLKIILACLKLERLSQKGEFVLNSGDVINIGSQKIVIDTDQTKIDYDKTIKFPAAEDDDLLDFSDIDYTDWYIPYLQDAVHRDLVKGYDDRTIRPHQQVSLAELLTVLSRSALAKSPDLSINLDVLPDYLDEDAWYAQGIAFGLEQKLIGIEEGKRLAPFYDLNRAEAIIIVYNYIVLGGEADKSSNEDTTSEPSATTEVEVAVEDPDPVNEESSETTTSDDFKETGIASYYSRNLNGANTASGEALDVEAFQAAHKTLPFNTIVKVTNVDNGKWVKARIVDRGPHIDGRVIDLTPSAFEAIAELSAGLANVELVLDNSNQ